MVLSMTGYGSAKASLREAEIEVSLRSLNGRFLEVRCHLPREYVGLERDIKKLVSTSIGRGTVDVYVQRRSAGGSEAELVVKTEAAQTWAKAARKLAKDLGIKAELSLGLVLSQPEVMNWRTREIAASEFKQVLATAGKAIKSCDLERQREGKSIEKHLSGLLKQLTDVTSSMEKMAGQARGEISKRLDERMKRSPVSDKIEPGRLSQELALYLDRADVEEELHRLKEHLLQCQEILRGKESPGKKLDFYVQELHREVNTVGSKSPMTEMTQAVVEAKALIEQIKEQVQNIV